MISCPLCLKIVTSLKTGSHVIPRFILKRSKVKGRNVLITTTSIHTKNQSDITGDLICKECEDLCTRDDNFAKAFFHERKYLTDTRMTNEERGIWIYDPSSFSGLQLFIFSVLLRYHLYVAKYETSPGSTVEKDLLGEHHFTKLRLAWLKRRNIENEYETTLQKLIGFEGSYFPTPFPDQEEIRVLDFMIEGYQIWVWCDSRRPKLGAKLIIGPSQVAVLCMPFKESKLYINALQRIDALRKK